MHSIFVLVFSAALASAIPWDFDRFDYSYYAHDDLSSKSDSSACDCVCGVPNKKQRIVGGNVTLPNEYPWMVALEKKGKFYCGATLISENYMVTAAHCVDGFKKEEIKAYLGVHNRLKLRDTITRNIADTIVHSKFDIFTFDNDIALLKLSEAVSFSNTVKPACLPDDEDFTGQDGIVAGWGRLGERRGTAVELMKVHVPIITDDACKKSGYGEKRITKNMICAGYKEGMKDGCQGDSGGPMIVEKKGRSTDSTVLAGVVSWGRGCARPNFPGVYTKVSNYIDWIKENTKSECFCSPPY